MTWAPGVKTPGSTHIDAKRRKHSFELMFVGHAIPAYANCP